MSEVGWLDDGEPGVGSQFQVAAKTLGYTVRFTPEVTEWDPPYYFAYRQKTGPVLMDAAMQWVPKNDGCRFLIGGNPQANNLLVKLAEPFLWANLVKQNMDDLVRLKELLES
jgi:hypothetical protein